MIRISTYFNDLGSVSDTNLRRWTKASVECYYNGLMCERCVLPEDIKNQCKMKPVVLELVKKFGKPHKEKKTEIYQERLNRLLTLQEKYPFSNAIASEIDKVLEKIEEEKWEED